MEDLKLILSVDREFKETITSKNIKGKCQFCKIDTNKHAHFFEKNNEIVEACSMCYYAENLDKIQLINKGKIILLPEMTQEELFAKLRMCWFIDSLEEKLINTKYEEIIDSNKNIISLLEDREEFAANYYASGINNVDIYVNYLHSMPLEDYNIRDKGFLFLRWMPNKDIFKEELKYWFDKEYKRYTPNKFKDFIKSVASQLSNGNS